MAGHVVNPSTKFEDPSAIRSWVMSSDISHRIPLTGESRSLGGKISGERGRPPANILIPLERQLIALQLCSRLFVLYCRSRPKDDKYRHFDPHFDEVRGGVVPRRTLMDGSLESPRRVLVKHNWTSFSVSYGWGATRQNVSKLAAFRSEVIWSQNFRGKGSSLGNIFWFLQN